MEKLGFVGLGQLGFEMAARFLKMGYEVTGFNRTKSLEEDLARLGGSRVSSLGELASTCDVIMICVSNEKVVESTIFGENGLLSASAPKFRYLIDFSTIDLSASEKIGEELKKKGIHFFDSPVSGGPPAAREGTLAIYVGGDESAFAGIKPIYDAVAKSVFYFGPVGSGLKVKFINQILCWVNHVVICEAGVLAKKAGLDEDRMYDAIMASRGYSRIFETWYKLQIQPENHENTFAGSKSGMIQIYEDLEFVKLFAKKFGAKIPMTELAQSFYQKAVDDGLGNKDQSIVMKYFR